jgi:HEAT repeat protein
VARRATAAALALTLALSGAARADRVAHFMGRLESSSFKVRFQAAYILGILRDPRAIPNLIKALRDPHYAVRAASAVALGKLGGPLAAVSLVTAIADAEPWVRAEVVRALGILKERDAWTKIVASLEDIDLGVRVEAVRSLGRMGEKGAVLALAGIIEKGLDDDELADEARRSLRKLASAVDIEEMIFLLKAGSDRHQRARAAVVLGELRDERAMPVLIEMLLDKEPYVRGQCALALGALGDRNALEALKQLVAREADQAVRRMADLSVARLRRKLSVP